MKQVGYSPLPTLRVSQPRDVYPHQALDVFGMRRLSRQRHFLAGVICAATGLGLCGEGLAMAIAPAHPEVGEVLFFVAIVVPFTIFLTVLMIPRLGSLREITVAILGLYPALVYRMSSPLVLPSYDEHLHAQTLTNLLLGGGLLAPNPGLPVSPYYPGLEISGVAIRLTGLPAVLVESLVVLLCRLLLVLIIYHAALLVSPSRRGASLVVAFYAVSSHFYSFDSGFAYETLALPWVWAESSCCVAPNLPTAPRPARLFFIASLALVATVVTHHATSWIVLAFLIAWATMSGTGKRKPVACAAIVMGIAVAIWAVALAPLLVGYFAPILKNVIQNAVFSGGNRTSHLRR